jgi:hypothetical protein
MLKKIEIGQRVVIEVKKGFRHRTVEANVMDVDGNFCALRTDEGEAFLVNKWDIKEVISPPVVDKEVTPSLQGVQTLGVLGKIIPKKKSKKLENMFFRQNPNLVSFKFHSRI